MMMAQLSKEQMDAQLKKAKMPTTETCEVSFDEINTFGDRESLLKMYRNIAGYNKMLGERITLINDSLTAAVPFTRENLYLFCAYTGSGKSTVAANISYPLWKQGKKVLVVSNEETEQDVLLRIACLEKGFNFNDYKKGTMPQEMLREICALMPEIAKYVKVLDVTWREGLTTKIEGVKGALNALKGQGFSCVLIDYYQLIKYSITQTDRTTYDVLNDLRTWLGQYIKSSEVPVCLFVQLYSQSKRPSKGSDIDTRIKDCSAIVEPATVIIEIVPNHDELTTDFIIHKDRFGVAGSKITCPFEKGRFLKQISEKEQAERALDKLQSSMDKAK
jgi:replicative DNA helicase